MLIRLHVYVSDPHETAAVVAQLVELNVTKFSKKLFAFISDNASTMKAAGRQLKPRYTLSCVAHTIQLAVKDAIEVR